MLPSVSVVPRLFEFRFQRPEVCLNHHSTAHYPSIQPSIHRSIYYPSIHPWLDSSIVQSMTFQVCIHPSIDASALGNSHSTLSSQPHHLGAMQAPNSHILRSALPAPFSPSAFHSPLHRVNGPREIQPLDQAARDRVPNLRWVGR